MISLRPYQEDGITAIWNYFSNGGKGNPLIAWPTGVGKSVLPAVFIKRIMKIWPNQRFLLLTHISELIKQNAEVLQYIWPNCPLGIYSAGLGKKQPLLPVVFAGIQSAIKNITAFSHRDIIFIDEAHLISQDDKSQYLTFLATMKMINPNVKIVGMTATPFRMGHGLLTDGGLFTDIVHDLTSMDEFNKLIEDGYLCPLVPRRTKTELDVSNVGINKGEYIASQLQKAVDINGITLAGLKEVIEAGQNRKSWLIFSSGIDHAEHIASMLGSFGIDCAAVHSKQHPEFNEKAIRAFKSNQLRSIVNYSKLTTGFNHPDIDLIADFRPTLSIPLHIQKLGRGTRPAEGKKDCMVLDFGRNVPRLGPINDPVIPRKKGEKVGDVPVKICDACGVYNHTKVRFCTACENEFQFKVKITAKASTTEIIKSDQPIIEQFDVTTAIYAKKQKEGNPSYIRATYFCGMQAFSENIFPEHSKARYLFVRWWQQRHKSAPPLTTDEALKHTRELRTPKRIHVWVNKNYPEIKRCEWIDKQDLKQ